MKARLFALSVIAALAVAGCASAPSLRGSSAVDATQHAKRSEVGGAKELPDCRLGAGLGWDGSKILERARPTAETTTLLNVSGQLRNGTALTYAKDDPVLVADLGASTTKLTLVPTKDFILKSSWAMSFSFRFQAQVPITAYAEVKLDDGRKFLVVRSQDAQVLFIDEQGRFCNKALNTKITPNVWAAGTLSQMPDDAAIAPRVAEDRKPSIGFRVIFNGVSGGQLSFQEVWADGPIIVASHTRNFDQFAQRIKVGPFAFDVLEVGSGKVTLRYNIPDRVPVSAAEWVRLPMRAQR